MVQKLKGANSWKWDKWSRQYRKKFPLCSFCMKEGRVTAAAVVDHIIPHRGDHKLLFEWSNLQSLCKYHHDSVKQAEEKRGYTRDVGLDGWPVDKNHPANRTYQCFSIPHNVRPSSVPVMIVCGPPVSGKTTYVRDQAMEGDLIIDLDDYKEQFGERYSFDPAIVTRAFARRNADIISLSRRKEGRAWLIVSAPTSRERLAWKETLGERASVRVVSATREECKRRVDLDERRRPKEKFYKAIDWYFEECSASLLFS